MNATQKQFPLLGSLFNRFEAIKRQHPGWGGDLNKYHDEVARAKSRIVDYIWDTLDPVEPPDQIAVFHNFHVYRIDLTEGDFTEVGMIKRHLPCDTELMQLAETI